MRIAPERRATGGKFRDQRGDDMIVPRIALLCCGVSCVALGAGTAFAQSATATAQAAAATVPEVVVTALKRSDTVQNVPATITVVSGQTLQNQIITSAMDLPTVAPGLQIQSGPGSLPVALIHGLGSNAGVNSFDQSVSLFVDGIYSGHGQAYVSSLFDINDVEVVKGTQSALLGKNTSIGAVTLTTRKPGARFGYDLSYAHEFELGSDVVNGAVNIPLSDTLAVRIAGVYSDMGGWIHNDLTNSDSPETKTTGGRISLRWRPDDRLDWTLSFQSGRADQKGPLFYVAKDGLGIEAGLAAALGDPAFTAQFNDHTRQSGRNGAPDAFYVNHDERVVSDLSYRLGGYTLTSLTGYYRDRKNSLFNAAALPNSPINAADPEQDEQISQELRIVSPKIGQFDYVAGALYMHDIWSHDSVTQAFAPLPLTGSFFNHYAQYVDTVSVFAQGNYDLTEKLRATGGIRYTSEDKAGAFYRTTLAPGIITFFLDPPIPYTRLSRSESDVDGSVGLQYRFSPGHMIYASWGKGTKGGGYQSGPKTLADAEYRSESASSFEIGAKWEFGSRGHVDVAYFNTHISDFQLGLFNGTKFIVDNIPLDSQGVDFEGAWNLTSSLSAALTVTYADARDPRPDPTKFYGSTTPDAPRWSGQAALSYNHPLTERYDFAGQVGVQFRSKMALQESTNTTVTPSDGFTKVNLRLAVSDRKSGVEVALVGKNLNNERSANFGFPAFPNLPQAYLVSTDPPRTIAVQVSIKR